MNVKKSIVAIATSIVAFASLGSVTASAFTDIPTPYTNSVTLSTFEGRCVNTMSNFYSRVGSSALTAKSSDYTESFKYAYYAQHGNNNGSYYYIKGDDESGNSNTVITDTKSLSSEAVRRIHSGELHSASNASSPIVKYYSVTLNKLYID